MKDDVRINLNAEVMRCRDQAGPTRRSIQGMGGARSNRLQIKRGTSKRWRYVFTPTLAGLRWPVQPGVGHWPPPRQRKSKTSDGDCDSTAKATATTKALEQSGRGGGHPHPAAPLQARLRGQESRRRNVDILTRQGRGHPAPGGGPRNPQPAPGGGSASTPPKSKM